MTTELRIFINYGFTINKCRYQAAIIHRPVIISLAISKVYIRTSKMEQPKPCTILICLHFSSIPEREIIFKIPVTPIDYRLNFDTDVFSFFI
ncbi:hypothetical protein A7D27_21265 [Pseudomonas sp. 1D4]|nr:hypothetical protein A7D27_21265 [Pseudomonas sp. 1D4]